MFFEEHSQNNGSYVHLNKLISRIHVALVPAQGHLKVKDFVGGWSESHSVIVFLFIFQKKPISGIIKEYAKKVKKDQKYLQFIFDGEELDPEQTPEMFDMEDGDVIDVKELSELLPADIVRAKKAKLASSHEVIEIS